VDGATARGIPSEAELETRDEGEIWVDHGQSDVEIYIIGSPVKYMLNPMTNVCLQTEIYAREFPKM
jgi:hypothetical protein